MAIQMQRARRAGIATAREAETIERPVFLIGCVRSGTTLLRLMLDHHPDVAFEHEFEYVVDLIGDDGRIPDLKRFHDYLRAHRIFQDSGHRIDPELDFPALVNSFLLEKRRKAGKALVGATVHVHFDRLLWIWPEARFIHLVRDGRDVGRSMVEIGFTGNAYAAVEQWKEVEELWSDFAIKLPRDRWVDVRYEDLVAEPEPTLGRVCEFLGVPFDPHMFDYTRDTGYRAPSPDRTRRWKEMTPAEVDVLEAKIAGMLLRRGYELSERPLREISAREHRRLVDGHRLGRARFRIKRYGLGLFLASALARRLGIEPIRRKVEARIDAVDRRHLQ